MLRRTEHRFYAEIVTDITTWNSEHQELRTSRTQNIKNSEHQEP